ncbi:CopD family protein [Streptomyces sp. CWNU-1]|uniref:CopD family protein n=1 Tax=Streptomyces albipurpureus TaxID=2897419 RepID=A0ABT0UIG7_9ACTN|nr:CopD family protein [Streptomyces sp. CWNU-1]MCM2387789.1 CopD family protein [Streptomyces sp. CWNU-1]
MAPSVAMPRAWASRRAIAPTAALLATALAIAYFGTRFAMRDTGELPIPAAGTATLLRTVVFVALTVHLGELVGKRLVNRGALPRSWSRAAALAGAVGAGGQIIRLAVVSDIDMTTAYGTREGQLLLIMANGFLAAAGCAALRRPALAAVPLALVIVAEAIRAHPEQYSPEFGAALTVCHLTAASLWAGGLLYVLRALRLRQPNRADAKAVLAGYARLAAWLLAALAVTGTLSTLRRLPTDVVLDTAYGRVLIVKVALVAVACALALVARHRMLRGRPDAQRPARVELIVLGVTLLISSILTVVPDPHWLSAR